MAAPHDKERRVSIADCLSTLLFVPGSRSDRFAKAFASDADVVCIDLEDAVAAKDKARAAVLTVLGGQQGRLAVRINGLKTRAGLEDLVALADCVALPSLLLEPKVESPVEVAIVAAVVGERGPDIVPLVETVRGVAASPEIATATRVSALMFGGGDLAAELGVDLGWEALRTPRGLFVLACSGAGIGALDTPFIALDDTSGLISETRAAKALGFTAKAAIHPGQIQPIQASPVDAGIVLADRVSDFCRPEVCRRPRSLNCAKSPAPSIR
jgi:(S)-citramalyl-CoA lyase